MGDDTLNVKPAVEPVFEVQQRSYRFSDLKTVGRSSLGLSVSGGVEDDRRIASCCQWVKKPMELNSPAVPTVNKEDAGAISQLPALYGLAINMNLEPPASLQAEVFRRRGLVGVWGKEELLKGPFGQ